VRALLYSKEIPMTHAFRRFIVVLSILGVSTFSSISAETSEKGELGKKVVSALKSIASGKCPEDQLSPVLQDQCEQALGRMQEKLSSLGEIREAQYKGIEHLPNGTEAEVYKVIFAKGTMLWLASAGSDGKLNALWSPG
jgi:hypothetical protein